MEQKNNSKKESKWQQITEKERYKIEGFLEEGLAFADITQLIGKSKRTIEREYQLGLVEQRRMNPIFKKYEEMYIVEKVYKADVAQMRHEINASNKGAALKIGNDHELVGNTLKPLALFSNK